LDDLILFKGQKLLISQVMMELKEDKKKKTAPNLDGVQEI
jgi:hypothetical protein